MVISRYEVNETLQLKEDSTFIWRLDGLQGDFRDGYQTFVRNHYGEGIYSRTGDTIVLRTRKEDIPVVRTRLLERKTRDNDTRRVRFVNSDKNFMISYVLYVNEYGDTLLGTNMMIPELGVLAAGVRDAVELISPKEIIDIVIEPLGLRPNSLESINAHDGDIEIKIESANVLKYYDMIRYRIFDEEKWTLHGDTIIPLTEDGYQSVYPLIKKDSVFESHRELLGKQYVAEFDSIKTHATYCNYKYYSQPRTNNYKRYGLVISARAYDKNGSIVAEGEYLSDTCNPFLRWYRYIKVGRWKYYEPDGTVRYVDY